MAIPIIVGGIVAVSALYGGKKGYDAYSDYDDAEKYHKWAKEEYDSATKKLKVARKNTNRNLEKLGSQKISIYEGSLGEFVDIFSKIKNINFSDSLDIGTKINVDYSSVIQIKDSIVEIKDVLGGGIASLGTGALAGIGAYGGVGLLASASTGTAISTLSGVAATNATLAWLGGGAIAAGGGGIALGTAVLGGIIAAPILAVGSTIYAAKAETAKNEAYSDYKKAKVASEEMKSATIVLDGILHRVNEFKNILAHMNDIFEKHIDALDNIVDSEDDYEKYSEGDKKLVFITASIAKTVKNICDAPIIDEEGNVTRKSKRVLKKTEKFMKQIEEV